MSDTDDKPQIISVAEAKALDLKFYFTGKPCKRGHTAERRVSSMACTECDALTAKARYEANPEKYRSAEKAYREANPEKRRAAVKAWQEANPEKRRASAKAYREANPEKVRAAAKVRYEANPEKVRAAVKAWQEANPEKVRATIKALYEANPEKVRATKKARTHIRRARKRNAPGRWTAQDIESLLAAQYHSCAGCDVMFYEEQSFHIDHRIPLSRGGSNWPSNLQILCPTCNLQKHAMTDEEWRASPRFPKNASVFACT